jgi:ribosomal protein L19E
LAALVKLIPGQIDDVLAAKYKEEIKAIVKEELIKAAVKIDGVV